MNVSKMSREKIAAALARGGRYMNHAREWVVVKVGERVNPDDVALALVSPEALIVREAVRMASKAGRGAKKAAGAVAIDEAPRACRSPLAAWIGQGQSQDRPLAQRRHAFHRTSPMVRA